MKHQYDALSSVEQGEAVELERPASADTLVNDQDQATEAATTDTTDTTNTPTLPPKPIPLPSNLATVRQVREYIAKILQDSFHVLPEEAETAASRWQGLGYHFRKIKVEEFREMLGDPYTSMIQQYQEAVAEYYQISQPQQRSSHERKLIFSLVGIFILVCVVMASK